MTNHETNTETITDDSKIAIEDPRYGMAMVVSAMHDLISESAGHLEKRTPCPEFAVSDLLDHVVLVVRRIALIGEGGKWDDIQQEQLGSGWGEAFQSAAQDIQAAWTDDAKLNQMWSPPWGDTPGGPMLLIYTAELAVHGWDLSQATGASFAVDDKYLAGAVFAAKQLPAEGRDDPEFPFGPVVQVSDSATAIEQMAAWMGRSV